jgi:hypothetical protein
MFKYILLLTTFSIFVSLDIKLEKYPNITVFNDKLTSHFFNFTYSQSQPLCSYQTIYSEFYEDSNLTNFLIIKSNNDNFIPVKLYVNNNNTNSYYTYNENTDNKSIANLEIHHNCLIGKSIIKGGGQLNSAEYYKTSNYDNYWSTLKFEFNLNSTPYYFEFIKFCKTDNIFFKILTAVIIFIIAGLFIYLSTVSNIELEVVNEVRENSEIKWWYGFIFIIFASIFLILIFYFMRFINFIYTILVSVQCLICCSLTISWYLKILLGKSTSKIFEYLKKEIYEIKVYKYISIIITFLIVYFWFVTRFWILNNILAYCLVFSILSLLLIKDFFICIVLLSCVFVYDAFWVFFSHMIFSQNVMVTVATSLNLPIKIEFPLLFINNPIKGCMLLGLGDIVLPGMVIKYCKRFDSIKNKNDKYSYYQTSIILYHVSLFLAFIMMFAFNHSQPVMFYISPIFIIGLSIKAYIMGDWNDFWRGKNLSGTQMMVDEMINGEFTRLERVELDHRYQPSDQIISTQL